MLQLYKARANVKAINSGGKFIPPLNLKDVSASWTNLGNSSVALTPPIKKLNKGKIIINPSEMNNTGSCFP